MSYDLKNCLFVNFSMMWGNTQGLFSSLTGHSTIAHLTAVKLKDLSVPLVPCSTLQSFLEKLRDLKASLIKVQESRKKAVRLRSDLLNLIEVSQVKKENFPGFGSMPWLKGFDEKEAQKAKKAIIKEV